MVVPSPGDVVRLGRGFLQKLRAHVLVRILEFDFFRDGDAVVRDGRRAVFFVERDVATLGAERRLDGIRHRIDANLEMMACLFGERELFCRHWVFLLN